MRRERSSFLLQASSLAIAVGSLLFGQFLVPHPVYRPVDWSAYTSPNLFSGSFAALLEPRSVVPAGSMKSVEVHILGSRFSGRGFGTDDFEFTDSASMSAIRSLFKDGIPHEPTIGISHFSFTFKRTDGSSSGVEVWNSFWESNGCSGLMENHWETFLTDLIVSGKGKRIDKFDLGRPQGRTDAGVRPTP